MSQHVTAPVPALVGLREPVAKAVDVSVARALAKEPADRYATAGDFATAYERALVEARQPSAADLQLRSVEERHATRQRVLVLEFANIAGAADAEWLSTGIAETLGADLNKIAGITVIAQDAGMRRRIDAVRQGRSLDVTVAVDIGRAVGARWVVWGAFQKFGPRIRLTSHFADAEKGTLAGGEKIDGVMDDIFALQDRIVTSLADVLRIQLTSAEVARIERPETTNLSAYEHYARGYAAFQQFGKESVKAAAEHYRAAIALDPNYALAHAGLGMIHGPMYIATGRREVLDEGAKLLERAIHLDSSIGEAHAWLAYLQFRQDRFDDAVRTARQGIEHDPRSHLCWYMLACAYFSDAVTNYRPTLFAQAVPPYLRAMSLDPSLHPAHMALGAIYILRGEYGHARGLVDRAVAIEQEGGATGRFQFLGAMVQRAVIHLGSDEPEEAARLLAAAIARYVGADHVYAETMSAYAYTVRGCLAEWTGRLDDAVRDFTEACRIADAHEHRINIGAHWLKARFGLARVLHQLGRRDQAERMLAEGDELLRTRSRFIWTWFLGGSDADALYAQASAFAAMGRATNALETLRRAADAGWADVGWMRHDPAFTTLRDSPEMFRLCSDASACVILPPPIGGGGLE